MPPPTGQAADTGARHRLLDAAETLLRHQGYDSVSVRAVNKAAGMNPAAVHYHFGSKQALVAALLESRMRPLFDAPLAALDGPSHRPPDVAALVTALVEPLARMAADPARGWLVGLLARLVLTGTPLPWRSPWPEPEVWTALLAAALPGLPPDAVAARWLLARDLVLLTLGAPFTEPGAGRPVPSAAAVAAFATAGLTAPPTPEELRP